MTSRAHKKCSAVNRYKRFFLTLFALALLALALPAGSLAAATNDNFADATVIGTLPFTDAVDNTTATTESGEPQFCYFSPKTVWYSFTAGANAPVKADMAGSSFGDTILRVYQQTGSGFGGLVIIGCGSYADSFSFNAQAGTTYYIQAGSIYSDGGDLQVNLNEIPPPANDDFVNATLITALPFSETTDTSAASTETGEPAPSCASTSTATIWYAFTPETSGSVSAYIIANRFSAVVAVYTGNPPTGLTEIGCRSYSGLLTFHADSGTTYYVQVGGAYSGQGGPVYFQLDVAPPPVARFFSYPNDPSIFDTVQFYDASYDPGNVGFQSYLWSFGDGATATGCCPTHRYTADRDYTVEITVTTFDGRTASNSQIVHVKTHDVAITRFFVPNSAASGQTRDITVGVSSKLYPENVQVQLFKSAPGSGGYQLVGTLTQFVPVRQGNRTTDFSFSYTFTSDDASIGKVTFMAVAAIVAARDALPADNEAIAPPTNVMR